MGTLTRGVGQAGVESSFSPKEKCPRNAEGTLCAEVRETGDFEDRGLSVRGSAGNRGPGRKSTPPEKVLDLREEELCVGHRGPSRWTSRWRKEDVSLDHRPYVCEHLVIGHNRLLDGFDLEDKEVCEKTSSVS